MLRFLADLALRLAICAGATYGAWRYLGEFWPVVVPIWGVLLAKPIIEIVPAYVRALREEVFAEWQGRYYAFDGHHVRVLDVDGEPWIVDTDLVRSLGQRFSPRLRERLRKTLDAAEYDRLPDTRLWGFSERGALKYLERRQDPQAMKLKLWLEREVYLVWHKRAEREATG